jgi:pantothenate kinase-related protein Tda10
MLYVDLWLTLGSYFGALVHIDAVDTLFVYEWRLQQERALREAKGTGMKDKQVIEFVNGCECLSTIISNIVC